MFRKHRLLSQCWRHLALAGLLFLSAGLNLYNNTFPLGYHYDEPKKVRFVKSGDQDFHHPLLMLQIVRIANRVLGYRDDHKIVVLGRSTMALAGVLIPLLSYLLARRTMTPVWSLLTALGVAVSPIVVIHAHYFKEDILFAACALFCLWQCARFLDEPRLESAFLLGIAAGLAGSAHYKAGLLILLFLLLPLVTHVRQSRRCYMLGFLSAAVAVYVFLLVNWPIFAAGHRFLDGLKHEWEHVLTGHDVRISPWPYWFSFHFTHSLIPGLTLPVALLALAGTVGACCCWRSLPNEDRVLLLYALLFYLVAELSPLKPWPDFARYMVPVAPVLVYFAFRALQAFWALAHVAQGRAITAVLGFVALCIPLSDTVLLDYYLTRDTRAEAKRRVEDSGKNALFERYAAANWDVLSAADLDWNRVRNSNITFVVASSFQYERYFVASRSTGNPPSVYRKHRRYLRLFSFPYREIRPRYRSLAFSNPVIRIVRLRKSPDRADAAKQ